MNDSVTSTGKPSEADAGLYERWKAEARYWEAG